jgi:3-hydroxyisobutyrate dehydrogenase-like beta-hydroxyacid dehydrogenase
MTDTAETPLAGPQFRLGVIGLGEVGSSIAGGLRDAGLHEVRAYDPGASDGPFVDLVRRRAREAGVELVGSLAELVEQADVLIGVTPGSQSVRVAGELGKLLGPRHVYADFASGTPAVKREVADAVAPSGTGIVDGAIVGYALQERNRTNVLISGPDVQRFSDALVPWGMRLEVVGDDVGAASGLKSLRSVVTKGLEALIVECLVASERYGIRTQVVDSIGDMLDRFSFAQIADFLVSSGAIHARRRSEEAAMSARTVEAVDVEPIMTRATAQRLGWVAGLHLDEHFGGVVPDGYSPVLEAINAEAQTTQGAVA